MTTTGPEDLGTVRWFGAGWDAPVNRPATKIPVPVGASCLLCSQGIAETDTGVTVPFASTAGPRDQVAVYHLQCFFEHYVAPVMGR